MIRNMCQNNVPNITMLAYDLVQNGDTQLNNDIRNRLIALGWADEVLEEEHPAYVQLRDSRRGNMPETTLVKRNVTAQDAQRAFQLALNMYDAEREQQNVTARGTMVACDGQHIVTYTK